MQLERELLAAQMAGLGLYALIDPALRPEIVSHGMAGGARHPLTASGISATAKEAAEVLPFVIALDSNLDAVSGQLHTLKRWAVESHAVIWMASTLTAEVIAQQLGKRLNAMLTDDQPVILRFSDARILPSLHAVLTPEQRAQFFAPMPLCWYMDRQEQLRCIRTNAEQPSEAWPSPWTLTAEQEVTLLKAAEADTVLALLQEQAPDDLQTIPRAQRHQFVCEQLVKAAPWRIESATQQTVFCLMAINLGADFSEQPMWQAELTKVRDGTLTLMQAIEHIEGLRE